MFVPRFLPDPFAICLLFLWPECMCDWLIGKHVNQLFVFIFLCWPKPTEPVWTGSEGQPSVLLYKILMFDCSPSSLWVPWDSLCWSFLQKAPIKYRYLWSFQPLECPDFHHNLVSEVGSHDWTHLDSVSMVEWSSWKKKFPTLTSPLGRVRCRDRDPSPDRLSAAIYLVRICDFKCNLYQQT